MKKLILISAILVLVLPSCQHKDLCYHHREHAHKYHMNIVADYRYDWEEHIYDEATDWEYRWPDEFTLTYDELRHCANKLAEKGEKYCLLFSTDDEKNYIYIIILRSVPYSRLAGILRNVPLSL